jgi:hypothetical protein
VPVSEDLIERWLSWLRVPLLVALAITGLIATSRPDSTPEAYPLTRLHTELEGLRAAIRLYRDDHGRAPCQPGDDNRHGDPAMFVRQLTCYTNSHGRPAGARDEEYGFGPYLAAWPVQSITRSGALRVRIGDATSPRGGRRGGWIYDARDGSIAPDLPDDWGSDAEAP